MINEGRPVYGLAGYVNEITTFGELDCSILCTHTHTYTRTCTQNTHPEHNLLLHARPCPRSFPKFAKRRMFRP